MGGIKDQDFASPPSKSMDPPSNKKRLYQVWRGRNVNSFLPLFLFLIDSLNFFVHYLIMCIDISFCLFIFLV